MIDKTLEYAIEFYEELYERSSMVDPRDFPELRISSKTKIRLYHGKLKDVAAKLGFSTPQSYTYSGILYRVEAVTRLAVATPHGDGYWMLNFKPTLEQLKEYSNSNKKMTSRIAPSRIDILLSELADLRARVTELEKLVGNDIRRGKKVS